jgi:hypothetical protein
MNSEFEFSVIVRAGVLSADQILDIADALSSEGCNDASIRGHADGMELLFASSGTSLQWAIASAISDVERAGFEVARVEMARDAAVQAG